MALLTLPTRLADDWEGPGFQACADAAYVCKAIETSRRREVLSFHHHAEVAAIPIGKTGHSFAMRNCLSSEAGAFPDPSQ
jgi:hypothetical protein